MRRLPLHPMLVHFPIVFWTLAPVLGSAWLWLEMDALRAPAWWSALLGLLTAVPAMIFGIVDMTRLPDDDRAKGLALTHMMSMATLWLVQLLALGVTGPDAASEGMPQLWLVMQWTVFAGMLAGAWIGGRLVYHHGVGSRR